MRYAEGGGLTAEGRAGREDVRLQAARLFEQGLDAHGIARILRVSTKSVYQWRRAWRADGDVASPGCFTYRTRCEACRTCCTGWGSPPQVRCTGPLSEMRTRSRPGGS